MNAPHIASLTSIRGIAAWWVAFHNMRAFLALTPDSLWGAALGRGYLAVDLFFILSGFIIQVNYGRALANPSRKSIRQFLVARVARIYPLHLFLCLMFLLNPLALWLHADHWTPGIRYDWDFYLLSLLLVQNWGFTHNVGWNVPAWSISAELGAYLLFPLAAFLVARVVRNRIAALVWAGSQLLILAVVFHAAGLGSTDERIWQFGLIRCVLQFLAGIGIGQLFLSRGAPQGRAQAVVTLMAGGLLGAWLFTGCADYIFIPACFTLLIYALSADTGPLARIMHNPVLSYLGTISYSTYLWHYLVRDWVSFVLVRPGVPIWVVVFAYVVIVFVGSVVLYNWVELPGRMLIRRWGARRTARPFEPVASQS
jgi:peptidoglycan/LPS O-acetylase OafA/YrhL